MLPINKEKGRRKAMSADLEAKLFYGYIKPKVDDNDYGDEEEYDEDPWSNAHTKRAHGCIGAVHGYDENLGYFLAVEESLQKASWEDVTPLTAKDFEVKPEWDEALNNAATEFGIDLTGLNPGLYLVCLYF